MPNKTLPQLHIHTVTQYSPTIFLLYIKQMSEQHHQLLQNWHVIALMLAIIVSTTHVMS